MASVGATGKGAAREGSQQCNILLLGQKEKNSQERKGARPTNVRTSHLWHRPVVHAASKDRARAAPREVSFALLWPRTAAASYGSGTVDRNELLLAANAADTRELARMNRRGLLSMCVPQHNSCVTDKP